MLKASAKNQIWVGDITYIPTKHGWLYLAVFIDIFSRKVKGRAMDVRVRDTLVLSALNSHWTGTSARGIDYSYKLSLKKQNVILYGSD